MASDDSEKELSAKAVSQIVRLACQRYGAEYVGGRFNTDEAMYSFKAVWGETMIYGTGRSAQNAGEDFVFQLAAFDQLRMWRDQIADLTSEGFVENVEDWLHDQNPEA